MKKQISLVLAILAIGILLFFVHLGIFVYIYLPVCFILALIILVKRKIVGRKPDQMLKKSESIAVAEPKTVWVSKHPRFRKILGLVTLLTIFPITPLLGCLMWYPGKEGSSGPLLFFLMFIDFNFIFFTYPGIITGFYLLLSKRVHRIIGIVLSVTVMPLQLIFWVPSVIFLLKGQTGYLFLFPILILVPAVIIYSIFEPAKLE